MSSLWSLRAGSASRMPGGSGQAGVLPQTLRSGVCVGSGYGKFSRAEAPPSRRAGGGGGVKQGALRGQGCHLFFLQAQWGYVSPPLLRNSGNQDAAAGG